MFEIIPFDYHTSRSSYDPFRHFEELERQMFSNSVSNFRADVMTKGDSFVIEAELPGFKKEDISLDIEDDILTIKATRQNEESSEDEKKLRRNPRPDIWISFNYKRDLSYKPHYPLLTFTSQTKSEAPAEISVGAFAFSLQFFVPVDPNPPAPRTVSLSSSLSINSTDRNGRITSWAILSCGSMVRSTSLSLESATEICPR